MRLAVKIGLGYFAAGAVTAFLVRRRDPTVSRVWATVGWPLFALDAAAPSLAQKIGRALGSLVPRTK